jgi:hypothetical protein
MERSKRNENRGTPNRLGNAGMSAFERARAQEGMNQAMLLADLTLAGLRRVRNALSVKGYAGLAGLRRRGISQKT